MSLIPSESYSFPDHFTSTVVPSRRPKKAKPEPVLEKARKKPAIVALRDPEPESVLSQNGNGEMEMEPIEVPVAPVPVARPNPALRRVHAPPTLEPKVRWNNRTPAMDPARAHNNNGNGAGDVLPRAQNVISMKPAKPARPPQPASPPMMMRAPIQKAPPAPAPPKVMPVQRDMRPAQAPAAPQPKPKTAAPVVSNPQTDFFEMFAESGQGAAARRRRQMKLRRFMACEAAALLVLLPLVILGVTADITAPALRWILNIFTIAAAVTVAVIPVVFYAFTPTLPDLER
jgi:hypothetical protein